LRSRPISIIVKVDSDGSLLRIAIEEEL